MLTQHYFLPFKLLQRESDKLKEFSDLQNSLLDHQKRNLDLLLLKKLLQPKKYSKNYLKSKFHPLNPTIQTDYPKQIESYIAKEQHLSASNPLQSHLDNRNIPIVLKNEDSFPLNIMKNDREHVFQTPATQIGMIKELSNIKSNSAHVQMDGLKGIEQGNLHLGKEMEELKMSKLTGKGNLRKGDLGRKGEDSRKMEVPVVLIAPKKGVVGGRAGKNEFLAVINGTEGGNGEKGVEARKKMTPSGVGNMKV